MDYTTKKAFTLIEFIFVITIIGILLAVALPKLNKALDERDRASFEHYKVKKHTGVVDGTTWDK